MMVIAPHLKAEINDEEKTRLLHQMVNSCNSLEQQLEYHLKIDVHLNFNCLS
jgi:hypothetical protein